MYSEYKAHVLQPVTTTENPIYYTHVNYNNV